MYFCTHMGGHQPYDAFTVFGGKFRSHWCTTGGQAVHPQRAVGVEHDFHHVRVFQRGGNQRPHRRAQHLDAPVQ